MIQAVMNNLDPSSIVEIASGGDIKVRTFFDSGILCMATLDDIMIDPGIDSRVEQIVTIVNGNTWPAEHPMIEMLEGYEGSLAELHQDILRMTNLDSRLEWD